MTTYKNRRTKLEKIADVIADMIGEETNAEFTHVEAAWSNLRPGTSRCLWVRVEITNPADNNEVYLAIEPYIEEMLAKWGGTEYRCDVVNPLSKVERAVLRTRFNPLEK